MSDPDLTVGSVLTDIVREWLVAYLRYPVLAINSGDGPPSQSVMWFELDSVDRDVIRMNTKVQRMKYRQLQADPRGELAYQARLRPLHSLMTARHDALSAGSETDSVEARERPLLEHQLADLAALKVTSELRQSLRTGSPEWRQAIRDEDGLIARVLTWAARRQGHLRTE